MTSTLCDPQIRTRVGAQDAAPIALVAQRIVALTELLARVQTAETPNQACRILADELKTYLGCEQVLVGLCAEGPGQCRVTAISHVDTVQPHSDQTRLAQSALQEAIARSDLTVWPAMDESQRYGLLAHAQYAKSHSFEAVASSPLRDERGVVRGAWLISGPKQLVCSDGALAFLRAAESPVASTLQLLARAQRGWILRSLAAIPQLLRRRRGKSILALLALLVGLLFAPVPYRVKCDCELEPVTRRFVAAPFDGPLEQTLVEPGDLVEKDQLLARMDGRDIRWELAGVRADLRRAAKERVGHVAAHESGKAEVARHEVDRLQLEALLLEARDQDLDVRSPIDGIVVTGDLSDVEGMPLTKGQVLFEVAPLDDMVVELAVPEDDVTYVDRGMQVRIRLDAFPMQRHEARVERIHPRSEVRDQENVFVAEVPLNNELRQLHPGMRGRAWIAAGHARLGWVLFRRPVAAAIQWLGW